MSGELGCHSIIYTWFLAIKALVSFEVWGLLCFAPVSIHLEKVVGVEYKVHYNLAIFPAIYGPLWYNLAVKTANHHFRAELQCPFAWSFLGTFAPILKLIPMQLENTFARQEKVLDMVVLPGCRKVSSFFMVTIDHFG